MSAPGNFLRVLLSVLWTALVGLPVVVVTTVLYAVGLVWARMGRVDAQDRLIESNAYLMGWVAGNLWSRGVLRICDVRVNVHGYAAVDWRRAHVVCANHASVFDILALARVVPPPFRFVAKRELLSWPVIGWALRPAGQIIVDRQRHDAAVAALAEAGQRRIHGQVIFFVEGTRTPDGELLPFKRGAFHFAIDHGLPVLPVAIVGNYSTLAKSAWWHLRPGHDIDVVLCAPIESQDDRDVESLLNRTRDTIAARLNRAKAGPAHGLGRARRLRLPPEGSLLSSPTLMTTDEIEVMIRTRLPEASVRVVDLVGDNNHFQALVVTPAFAGKMLVDRHQMVYGALQGAMKDRIHALSIKAYTPEEWERVRPSQSA